MDRLNKVIIKSFLRQNKSSRDTSNAGNVWLVSHMNSVYKLCFSQYSQFSHSSPSWAILIKYIWTNSMNHRLPYPWFCLINIKLNWKFPGLTVSDLITCLGNNAVISISSQKVTNSLIVDCCSLYQLWHTDVTTMTGTTVSYLLPPLHPPPYVTVCWWSLVPCPVVWPVLCSHTQQVDRQVIAL